MVIQSFFSKFFTKFFVLLFLFSCVTGSLMHPDHVGAEVYVDNYAAVTADEVLSDGDAYIKFLDGPEVFEYDENTAYVVFVHYRSWDQSVSSVDVHFGSAAGTRHGAVTRENEYTTEAWVATGIPVGIPNVDVIWSGYVEDAVIEVYKLTGVSQTSPVAEIVANQSPTDGDQPNLQFTYADNAFVFLGAVTSYIGDYNFLTPGSMDDFHSAETINVTAASGYSAPGGYADALLSWTQDTNWHWSGVGLAIRADGDEAITPTVPSLSFTIAPTDGSTTNERVRFAGTMTSNAPITRFDYFVDETVSLNTNQYTVVSDTEWDFDFEVDFATGEQTIYLMGENSVSGSYGEMASFTLNVVSSEKPTCTLENLGAQISDTTPTYTATCSTPDGVSQASYRIYHEIHGTIVDWTDIPTTTSGNWGDESVSFSFTSPVTLDEGAHLVFIDASNPYGQWISTGVDEAYLPVDRIVVEAVDNRAPRLHVNSIAPNPTIDQQPYVTGICVDDYTTEVNSEIQSIEYAINGGSWTSIYAHSAPTASASRIFEMQLPALTADQTHTIQVRCGDTAGNTTAASSQSVEVVTQIVQDPQEVGIVENFIAYDRQVPFYTDAVWGNGYLRLKEQFEPVHTALDTSNYMQRYAPTYGASSYVIKQGTDNWVWYVKEDEVVRYNTVTQARNVYDSAYFGASEFRDVAQVEDAQGNHLVWVLHGSGVILFDATANTFVTLPSGEFNTGLRPNRVEPDGRDGRIGAYIRTDYPDTTTNSNIVYVDTKGTFLDTNDDEAEWFTTPAAFNYSDIYSVTLDETNDALYMGKPGVGLVKVGDNGTPLAAADFIAPTTYAVPAEVRGVVVDADHNAVFFITSSRDDGGIYVITDVSADPWDFTGQTVTQLATAADVAYQSLNHLQLLQGPEFLGTQLFIGTDQGKVIYYNTNASYTVVEDDTLLTIDPPQQIYPLAIGEIVVVDYDTLFVAYDRLGLYEIDLVRGWDTTNAAVVLAPLPTHRLNINNITLQSLNIATRVDSSGAVAPQSQASAISYYSLDDGQNWQPLSPGETQNFDDEDYRLRFKIDLAQNPGTTPIVDEFNVAFGTYQTDPSTEEFGITMDGGSKWVNQDFSFTIQAQDQLEYLTPEYAGDVEVRLYNATSSEQVSFNVSAATLASGTATVTGRIAQAGEYYIIVSAGGLTGQSATFTVNQQVTSAPVPTIRFTADRYTITKGESLYLRWETAHFDTVSLSGVGSVQGTASLEVSPPFTSVYTLTGTSSYGTLTASVEVVVHQDSGQGDLDSAIVTGQSGDASASESSSGRSAQTTTISGDEQSDMLLTDETVDDADQDQWLQASPSAAAREQEFDGLSIKVTPVETTRLVKRGEKVRIAWDVHGNPDKVFVDYVGKEVSKVGHVELIAQKDLQVTITATKGDQTITQVVTIDVQDDGLWYLLVRNWWWLLVLLLLIVVLIGYRYWRSQRHQRQS